MCLNKCWEKKKNIDTLYVRSISNFHETGFLNV